MNKERILIIVRGMPGSGKSTFAEIMARENDKIFSADMFFEDKFGNYNWRAEKLRLAHKWCYDQVESSMMNDVPRIFVTNVFITEADIKGYNALARLYIYEFISTIMENRNEQINIHGVPRETIDKMVKKFSVKL